MGLFDKRSKEEKEKEKEQKRLAKIEAKKTPAQKSAEQDGVSEISSFKGLNGIIRVYEDRVILSKDDFAKLFDREVSLGGEKTYFFEDLKTVNFKKPTSLSNGYIQLNLAGDSSVAPKQKASLFSLTDNMATKETFSDHSTLVLPALNKKKAKEIEDLYFLILEKMKKYRKNEAEKTIHSTSIADEILKLQSLLESNAITQEEFHRLKEGLIK